MDPQKYQFTGMTTFGYSDPQAQGYMQQAPPPIGPGMPGMSKKTLLLNIKLNFY
jgi:hypothetical protein